MPFLVKEFTLPQPQKASVFVMRVLGCSQKESQRHLDKKRLRQGEKIIRKSDVIEGTVSLTCFEPRDAGVEPVFITPQFAVYDKPSNLLIHPKGYDDRPSLCDAIKSRFGPGANPIHRLDYETCGLVMVSREKRFEARLKELFSSKNIRKEYLALVQGHVQTPLRLDFPILSPLKSDKFRDLGIKSRICENGKPAITEIFPLRYDPQTNVTLIKAIPVTGRTHQIRIHLCRVGHKIVGESLYGVSDAVAKNHLAQKSLKNSQTPAIMLQAQKLTFRYEGVRYCVKSRLTLGEKP